jgi:Ca2+/H+ antiporter
MKRLFAPENWLQWLLIFLPVSTFLEFTQASPVWIFVTACLAIIPLAGLMGHRIEPSGGFVRCSRSGVLELRVWQAHGPSLTLFEVLAIAAAVGVVNMVAQDGETHWMEGVLLLAVYLVTGIAFFFCLPRERPRTAQSHLAEA